MPSSRSKNDMDDNVANSGWGQWRKRYADCCSIVRTIRWPFSATNSPRNFRQYPRCCFVANETDSLASSPAWSDLNARWRAHVFDTDRYHTWVQKVLSSVVSTRSQSSQKSCLQDMMTEMERFIRSQQLQQGSMDWPTRKQPEPTSMIP